MKFTWIAAAGAALAISGAMSPVAAEEACTFEIAIDDFEQADIDRLYACVKDALPEGYGKADHAIGSVYSSWKPAAAGPYAPGPHGNRFLFTYANDVAYDAYVQYTEDPAFSMPVGSVLAKESWNVNKKKKAPRKGPLFIMTKVAAGEADEFDNWVYSGVQPNGKVMKVKQSFCHDCHVAFEDQDSMGYPDTDVRLSN